MYYNLSVILSFFFSQRADHLPFILCDIHRTPICNGYFHLLQFHFTWSLVYRSRIQFHSFFNMKPSLTSNNSLNISLTKYFCNPSKRPVFHLTFYFFTISVTKAGQARGRETYSNYLACLHLVLQRPCHSWNFLFSLVASHYHWIFHYTRLMWRKNRYILPSDSN